MEAGSWNNNCELCSFWCSTNNFPVNRRIGLLTWLIYVRDGLQKMKLQSIWNVAPNVVFVYTRKKGLPFWKSIELGKCKSSNVMYEFGCNNSLRSKAENRIGASSISSVYFRPRYTLEKFYAEQLYTFLRVATFEKQWLLNFRMGDQFVDEVVLHWYAHRKCARGDSKYGSIFGIAEWWGSRLRGHWKPWKRDTMWFSWFINVNLDCLFNKNFENVKMQRNERYFGSKNEILDWKESTESIKLFRGIGTGGLQFHFELPKWLWAYQVKYTWKVLIFCAYTFGLRP